MGRMCQGADVSMGCTGRRWVVHVVDGSHVSSTGSMCRRRGVYVVVVVATAVATRRRLLHRYPSCGV
jgi:hypothetical protein